MNAPTRYNPPDDGGFLALTPDDFMILEHCHRHGPSPSSHIYRRLAHRSRQKVQERLALLSARTRTAHGGSYLFRPLQQVATLNPLSNHMVHDVTRYGEEALREVGKFREFAPAHAIGRQWAHDFMLSCFTSSIELECLQRPQEFTYLFHDEICHKIGRGLDFKINGKPLKPDRGFGIRYRDGSVRLFLVEADRGTEQNKVSEGRKSAVENLLQYKEFIGAKLYKEHLKISSGVLLIYLFTSPGKMANVKNYLKDISDVTNYILFKQVDGFGLVLKPPLPSPDFFTGPYQRVGRDSFFINRM